MERRVGSHLIDFNISTEARQLNRTILGISQCWSSCSMYLLKAYLNDGSHFVVIILRSAFATWAELNHFDKLILSLSFNNRGRIMKVS